MYLFGQSNLLREAQAAAGIKQVFEPRRDTSTLSVNRLHLSGYQPGVNTVVISQIRCFSWL